MNKEMRRSWGGGVGGEEPRRSTKSSETPPSEGWGWSLGTKHRNGILEIPWRRRAVDDQAPKEAVRSSWELRGQPTRAEPQRTLRSFLCGQNSL